LRDIKVLRGRFVVLDTPIVSRLSKQQLLKEERVMAKTFYVEFVEAVDQHISLTVEAESEEQAKQLAETAWNKTGVPCEEGREVGAIFCDAVTFDVPDNPVGYRREILNVEEASVYITVFFENDPGSAAEQVCHAIFDQYNGECVKAG
jgi:hypothetical protein